MPPITSPHIITFPPPISFTAFRLKTEASHRLIWNLLLPSPSYPYLSSSSNNTSNPGSTSSSATKSNKANMPVASSASAPSSIAHVLHAHYRAITDINWHPAERDVVASTGACRLHLDLASFLRVSLGIL